MRPVARRWIRSARRGNCTSDQGMRTSDGSLVDVDVEVVKPDNREITNMWTFR